MARMAVRYSFAPHGTATRLRPQFRSRPKDCFITSDSVFFLQQNESLNATHIQQV
jgi:hypothetical protein